MALKQSLQQRLLQKLSPQQIQLMKMLQLPTIELEKRIKEELELNPALDEGEEQPQESVEENVDSSTEKRDDFNYQDYVNDETPYYKTLLIHIDNNEIKIYISIFLEMYEHF